MRSTREGFSGVLKHIGLLILFVRLSLEQIFLTEKSSAPALKSPKNRILSYLLRYRSGNQCFYLVLQDDLILHRVI